MLDCRCCQWQQSWQPGELLNLRLQTHYANPSEHTEVTVTMPQSRVNYERSSSFDEYVNILAGRFDGRDHQHWLPGPHCTWKSCHAQLAGRCMRRVVPAAQHSTSKTIFRQTGRAGRPGPDTPSACMPAHGVLLSSTACFSLGKPPQRKPALCCWQWGQARVSAVPSVGMANISTADAELIGQ